VNKIAILLTNRANLARSQTVIQHLSASSQCEITILACSSFVLEKFGRAVDLIPNFPRTKLIEITSNIEGETLETQTKSTGLLLIELSSVLHREKPDVLVVVADRFEILAGAIGAAYQNIPVVHIQGGEVSGNIDDRVRNAVSMLSDLHFPCSEFALQRLASMQGRRGELMNHGCPAMDLVHSHVLKDPWQILNKYSHVGKAPKPDRPYLLLVFHPETEMFEQAQARARAFLGTMISAEVGVHLVMLWPNVDAGSDAVAKEIRRLRENHNDLPLAVYKHFSPEDYLDVMSGATALVGNSSSFLREGLHLGKAAVIVGTRQANRDCGENVVYAADLTIDLKLKVLNAISRKVTPGFMYGRGHAGKEIAESILHFIKKKNSLLAELP
jgi:UDP-hydrolysing UDP-N-acetyl-D-glucosamine 2-epimerase